MQNKVQFEQAAHKAEQPPCGEALGPFRGALNCTPDVSRKSPQTLTRDPQPSGEQPRLSFNATTARQRRSLAASLHQAKGPRSLISDPQPSREQPKLSINPAGFQRDSNSTDIRTIHQSGRPGKLFALKCLKNPMPILACHCLRQHNSQSPLLGLGLRGFGLRLGSWI